MSELFETFDEDDNPTGLVPRAQVHATGLWHRSVHVFLFRTDGTLWIQQRAADKDVYPGRWDLSVGEHLQPGEGYAAAALRGLREELGVTEVALEPLGVPRRWCCDLPERGIADHEWQQSFRGVHDGELVPDAVEVAAIRSIAAPELRNWIARDPDAFTPWLLNELRERPELGAFCIGRPGAPADGDRSGT